MSDIEEILREAATDIGIDISSIELMAAADEIERLRAENETLRRDVKTAVMGDSAELADVKRENEKLREALIALAEHCNEMEAQNHDYHTMGEDGAPCISEPLANAYAIMKERGDE